MPLFKTTSIKQYITNRSFCQIVLLLIFVGLLAVGLAAAVWLDNSNNRGVAWGPELPRIAQVEGSPLGVNLFLDREPDELKMRRSLALAQDMGAHWIKQLFPWEQIEPDSKGDFWDERYGQSTWEHYDRIVQLCQEYDQELIVRLDRPPNWARQQALAAPALQEAQREDPDRDITGPPDDLADYGDFVYAVVSRYRGQVRYIQLWNEPNLANEWNWAAIDPERFVQLLRVAYSRAKEADPNVVVIFPSLAPNDGLDPRHMSDLEFLRRVYQAGGAAYFDVMSAQLYGLGQPPDEHSPLGIDRQRLRLLTRTDVSRVVLLREIMEQYGDGNKAIWVGELGWNATPPDWEGQPSPWGRPVSEESKADYIVAALERSLKEWPWMGALNLWFLHWDGPSPKVGDPTQFFALVSYDFRPLPAYEAVRDWSAAGVPLGVGYHDLPPKWSMEATFLGTRLDLLLPTGTNPESIHLEVDGVTMSPRFWREEGTAFRFIGADGLRDGAHAFRLEGPPDLSGGFYVVREQPHPWLFPTLIAVLSLGLIAAVALLVVRLPAGLREAWNGIWQPVERFRRLPERWQALLVLGGMALSLAMLYRFDVLPLSLFLLAVLVLLALLRLDLALLVPIFTIPLYLQPIALAGRSFSPFEVTILACLAAAGLLFLRRRQQGLPLPRIQPALALPALAFVLICAGSLFWSTDRSFITDEGVGLLRISLREFRVTVLEPFLLYPLLLLAYPAIPSLGDPVGSIERNRRKQARREQRGRFWWPIDALVLSGVLVAVGGIAQVLLPGVHKEIADGVARASSVYGIFSPNNLALFLGRVLALAIAGGIFLPRSRRKWAYLAALPLLGGTFLLTYSRGGLIAMALLVLFYGMLSNRLLLWAEVGLGILGALFAALTGALDRLLATDTFGNRLTMWRNTWALVRENFWTGLGLDAFYHHYHRRYPELGVEAYWTPHNAVLEFWSRLGALGLAAAAWLYGAFFARAGRLYRQAQDPAKRILVLGLLGSVVYALAHGLLDGTFFAPDWAALFWLACGLLAVLAG